MSLKGDNQKLMKTIVDSEIQKFYDQHKDMLRDVDSSFEGFD